MSRWKRLAVTAAILICMWAAARSVLSMLANGSLFVNSQPVEVVGVEPGRVKIWGWHVSRLDMAVHSSNLLLCENFGIALGEGALEYPVKKGVTQYEYYFEVPEWAEGEGCRIIGLLKYSPLGFFGPPLKYVWETEEFDIPSNGGA